MKTSNAIGNRRKSFTPSSNVKSNTPPVKPTMKSSQLMKLFEDGLRDIYWAEKALAKTIPKMIRNVTTIELTEALDDNLVETREQIVRLEQVFESIGQKASGKKCEATQGLINETETIMEDCEEGPMCDAGIISAAQKIAHYEIASYGTLKQFAETLSLVRSVKLLSLTLDEAKATDKKLTEIAIETINVQASELVA
jgi:ferritin-like metal-binding protein YciE